jgi:hypothetical protein
LIMTGGPVSGAAHRLLRWRRVERGGDLPGEAVQVTHERLSFVGGEALAADGSYGVVDLRGQCGDCRVHVIECGHEDSLPGEDVSEDGLDGPVVPVFREEPGQVGVHGIIVASPTRD